MNVYEAALSRIRRIFEEFENVYVSFSGGKDSGVLLNICLDVARERNRRFKVLYIDLEGMYKETTSFVKRIIESNLDVIIPEWVCLPLTTTNSVSMYEPFWTTWEPAKKAKWIRHMPQEDYVITLRNNPFQFYQIGMTFEEFILEYAKAQSANQKTACLLGIRTQESLNRWRSVYREDVSRYNGQQYSVFVTGQTYNFYPLFDWKVSDIWVYNGKFSKDYNHIYDLMYRAGVSVHKMRICEPYGDEQKAGLNLFKVIEPETWVKVVGRVSGANFGNIYCNTKATGYHKIELPHGHTWKSYTKFLLKTLPEDTRRIYTRKFIKFIQYWRLHGSPLTNDLIEPIKNIPGVHITNEFSSRGKGDKYVVKFSTIPDTISGDNKTDMLSWKRMCMAIMKNDITCKSLSFSITKMQLEKRKTIMEKYKALL